MGGVPKKHQTHGKTRRRRSHLALTKTKLVVCSKCKMPVLPHRACASCGVYVKKVRTKAKAKPVTNKSPQES